MDIYDENYGDKMKLSIVTTLFKSDAFIVEFYERITKVVQAITDDYEIIFIDDGSPDDSLKSSIVIHKQDRKVKVIELSRNFGHHKAIITGLSYAKGDFVFLIDSDLEEEPELLTRFWEAMHADNELDVVYGVQYVRKGGFIEKISGGLFWKIFNFLSDLKIAPNQTTVRLMKKDFVDSLKLITEKELFLAADMQYLGFKQEQFLIKKHKTTGSTYTIRKKVQLLINAITAFSSKPLSMVFSVGAFITLVSMFYIFFLLFRKIVYGEMLDGWTSLIISLWFLGGLSIFSTGLIGLYLSKIFIEVKNRPRTIVRKIYDDA